MNPYVVLAAQTVPEFVNGLVSSYQTYKHYEYETKRLEVEIFHIKKQTKVALKQIESDLKIRKAKLKNDRLQMKQAHTQWMSMQKQAATDSKMAMEMLGEITRQLMSAPADKIEALQCLLDVWSQKVNINSQQRHESLMQIAQTAQLRLDADLKRLT